MSAAEHLAVAREHLAKAREFLQGAEFSRDLELYSVAVSDAVVSGINSKDAICYKLTRTSAKSDDHAAAVAELRKSGPVGAGLAQTLQRLLNLKGKSQYTPKKMTAAQANSAVDWAQRLYDGAEGVVNS